MPKTIQGFLMAAATTLIVIAIATRIPAVKRVVFNEGA